MNTEDILLEAIRYRIVENKDRSRNTIDELLDFDLSDVDKDKVAKLRNDFDSFLKNASNVSQQRYGNRERYGQQNTNSTPSILYDGRTKITENIILNNIKIYLEQTNVGDMSEEDIVFLGRAMANIAIAKGAKNTEMRRLLDSTKKIKNNYISRSKEFKREYLLSLKVNFDYFATRHQNLTPIIKLIDVFISRITKDGAEGFNQFIKLDKLFESLIVYHKVYGGREK